MNDNVPGDGGPDDDGMQTGWCLHTNKIYTVLIWKTRNGIKKCFYCHFVNCLVLSWKLVWIIKIQKKSGMKSFWKSDTHVRKYARYGKTGHAIDQQTSLSCRIFCGLPENTKNYFDPLKIDWVTPKTVKTRFVRARA